MSMLRSGKQFASERPMHYDRIDLRKLVACFKSIAKESRAR